MRIDVDPHYRVYFKRRGRELILLLAGGDEGSQASAIKAALPGTSGVAIMGSATRYDVAEHLRTAEEMAAYLEVCIEESNGDAAFIAKTLGDIARARGMT